MPITDTVKRAVSSTLAKATEPPKDELEAALHHIADKLRADDAIAGGMMTALNEWEWWFPETGMRYGMTWRAAGDVIAEARDQGEHYMDILHMQAMGGDTEKACDTLRLLGLVQCEYDGVEVHGRTDVDIYCRCDHCGHDAQVYVDEAWTCDCGQVNVNVNEYCVSWVRPKGTESVYVDGQAVVAK